MADKKGYAYYTKEEIDELNSYSTEEVATGAKWLDGKTIYKKTVNTGGLPNNSAIEISHSISDLYRVIKTEGYAYRSDTGQTIPLPMARVSDNVLFSVSPTVIRITTTGNASVYGESYITLFYTKSS